MGRNIFRQDTQIRKSESYTDNIAPSEANYETAPANINDDLNTLRSQAHNLLKNQAGKWYDDLNVPSTLETGAQRGVNDLNSALHLIEKKRVLRDVTNVGVDVTVPAQAKSTANLLLNSAPLDQELVTIGTKSYKYVTAAPSAEGEVLIEVTASDSLDNLIAAIMHTSAPGKYQAAAVHPDVVAAAGAGDSMDITAKVFGSAGNTIATSETLSDVASVWTQTPATHMINGAGDVVVLQAGELPDKKTAAVGVVATLGTVLAYNVNFTAQSLAEVAGGTNALSPRNLMLIVDAETGDPLLSGGREIWGLFQSESATDGHTLTGNVGTRAQITFVRPTATFDDLEFVPIADIAGKIVNYTTRERVRLEDLTEFDFLRGAVVDVGSGSGVIDRQHAYDNQGTTPVELAVNAILDLNAAGIHWEIRDLANAILLDIIEGSAGNSTFQVGAAVGTFDINAVLNDFLNGIAVDTGAAGTKIQVGVTPNQIDSGGALNIQTAAAGLLSLLSGGQLSFADKWIHDWTPGALQLSDSAAEWTAFEAQFGEVSLLNAITQAAAGGALRKVHATVTAIVNATNNVSLADANVDVAWGDLSKGDFLEDYDVFVNGAYNRPAAGATEDVYPGSTLGPPQGKLKFTYKLHVGDEIALFDRAA
jgi:hypothetical protein